MRGTDKVGLCFDKLGLSVDKPGLLMAVITFLDKPTQIQNPRVYSCGFDNVGYFRWTYFIDSSPTLSFHKPGLSKANVTFIR